MNKNLRIAFLLIPGLFASLAASAQGEWSSLSRYQETITADEFSLLVNDVYAPGGGMIPYLRYGNGSVQIYSTAAQTGAPLFELKFAESPRSSEPPKALSGLKVALDPGHIGGAWSRIEERFFLVDRDHDWPVQEAALNLYVCRLIRDGLSAKGATVVMVKDDLEPMTTRWPDERMRESRPLPPGDPRFAHLPEIFVESSRRDALRKQVEREFYRTDEIAARATKVNNEIKPDVTMCVHFNATGSGDEKTLYEENGLAFFVNGNCMPNELRQDDQKFTLMKKVLENSHDEEVGLAESIRDAFVAATGLPPAYGGYEGETMLALRTNGYIFARNLAANRQFDGPVVFLEPYFMNNRTVYARIQAGDYDGERTFDEKSYRSIFREYADAVIAGVSAYYGTPPAPRVEH